MYVSEEHGNSIIGNKPDNETRNIGTDLTYKHEFIWLNVVFTIILHLLGLWGFYVVFTGHITFKTFLWTVLLVFASIEGSLVGAHRFYSHRSFKVPAAVKAVFIICQTLSGQNSMFTWCRDHRLHHRYSDTDADPHNAKRGFFFSHIGWALSKRHPYVIELGRKMDMRDLKADWMVMFQRKYFLPLYFIIAVAIPVVVPVFIFNEGLLEAFLVAYATRYVFVIHQTCIINSVAHKYGTRPYDKNLLPAESWFVSLVSLGEGWHNYHHAFPWDYKAAEPSEPFNTSAKVIDLLAKIGLATDLKTVSNEMIKNRIKRTGDGTHLKYGSEEAQSSETAMPFAE